MQEPGLRTLFSAVVKALTLEGRPTTDIPIDVEFLLLPNQAAAVTAAVAIAGAAVQTSRSQHERSKLQSLQQW
eukprot:1144366-Pelagomonas_calceolata.AAC.1